VHCDPLSALVCLQYGSCSAPATVASVEALQNYLLDTSRTLRRRNTTAADALQQLAANIAESAPKAAALQQELNETRSYLHGHKDKIVEHMVEITSLKQKTGSQEQQIQQKQHELEQAGDAANSAKQEVLKLQQQLKEKEEQLKKQASQPAQQQQVATAPLAEDVVFGRMHVMEMAGLQCNPVKEQEVRDSGWLYVPQQFDDCIFGYLAQSLVGFTCAYTKKGWECGSCLAKP
jgi:predicted  nucleic acid-binding Zn-ribbon protein